MRGTRLQACDALQKCKRCEEQEKAWVAQAEINTKETLLEDPPRKKARSHEHTITDDLYDFIGQLDDKHRLAASRIIKVEIMDIQEARQEEEMLASTMSRTQISDQANLYLFKRK